MATEWINARDLLLGDRVNTTNGMREVLRIYASASETRIVIQDSGSTRGETDLYRRYDQRIERAKRK